MRPQGVLRGSLGGSKVPHKLVILPPHTPFPPLHRIHTPRLFHPQNTVREVLSTLLTYVAKAVVKPIQDSDDHIMPNDWTLFTKPWTSRRYHDEYMCMAARKTGEMLKFQSKYLALNVGNKSDGSRVLLSAHVLLCYCMHGCPPEGHVASHVYMNVGGSVITCKPSCLNPMHLRWCLPIDNGRHGYATRGARNHKKRKVFWHLGPN